MAALRAAVFSAIREKPEGREFFPLSSARVKMPSTTIASSPMLMTGWICELKFRYRRAAERSSEALALRRLIASGVQTINRI